MLSLRSTRPWDQRERLWWLLWSRCPGVGAKRISALIQGFGSLERAWHASTASVRHLCQWPDHLVGAVDAYRLQWGPHPLGEAARLCRGGRRVLLPGDRRWPATLQMASPPPATLYWTGRGSLWKHLSDRRAVAVVGTRRPSRHGLAVARQIGAALARGGWPVVSGLASGIDGAVHESCLQQQGVPVGVLGTPLERVYPRHHASLQASVGREGLLITELSPGAAVTKGSFAMRNRLQVALACAVILVECPQGSGALHSAELAWEEGLPLWVVPADIDRPSAEGSNGLLARGAAPLTRPEELLRFLGAGPLRPAAPPELTMGIPHGEGTQPMAHRLLTALGTGASMEKLCAALGSTAQEILPLLLELEASGTLRAEPGLIWRPA